MAQPGWILLRRNQLGGPMERSSTHQITRWTHPVIRCDGPRARYAREIPGIQTPI